MRGLIDDGDIWVEMLADRNTTTHDYNEAVALEIVAKIKNTYLFPLQSCYDTLSQRSS